MNLLLTLSLQGSAVFAMVYLFNESLASRISTVGRRWWWLVVPIAFLVTFTLPILPSHHGLPRPDPEKAILIPTILGQTKQAYAAPFLAADTSGLITLWLAGIVVYLIIVTAQTRAALRRWSHERLSTDSMLLNLLEDCKHEAAITAPIGLVVSDNVPTPAIIGWLRPRILLPGNLVASLSSTELRAVLFHELAHFRSLDVPFNWLFTVVRAVHWFNPVAHLAFRSWSRFQEESADETALTWMKDSSGATYGQALLHALRQTNGHAAPFGALAIGESIHNLKRRITMIKYHHRKSPHLLWAAALSFLLVLGFIARPVRADDPTDPKATAVEAMQVWLKGIDDGKYAESWTDASASFQKALTSDKWVAALTSVRTPLGKCTDRKLASALHQTEIPSATGTQKGDFVIAQFNSSFENLAYAVETVCFEKAPDGTWKASGYFIKPKS